MKDVMKFWLSRGVDGFRIDAVNHLYEVEDFSDDAVSGKSDDPNSYAYTMHYHTTDLVCSTFDFSVTQDSSDYLLLQTECNDMVYDWRKLLDDWQLEHGGEARIMMTEAYANLTFTMKYYGDAHGGRKGSHIPFNFKLIMDLKYSSTAPDFVHAINEWMTFMPFGETANWVVSMLEFWFNANDSNKSLLSSAIMTDHESAVASV